MDRKDKQSLLQDLDLAIGGLQGQIDRVKAIEGVDLESVQQLQIDMNESRKRAQVILDAVPLEEPAPAPAPAEPRRGEGRR